MKSENPSDLINIVILISQHQKPGFVRLGWVVTLKNLFMRRQRNVWLYDVRHQNLKMKHHSCQVENRAKAKKWHRFILVSILLPIL